ncbi:MAG TPA: hypothetical protein VGZ29_14260 [Terriglobia bacterium]|nr:hypothetical protein [Terriglobia bacterium]
MRLPAIGAVVAASCLAIPCSLGAQQLKPETVRDFECYVQTAEQRMAARQAFLLADSEPALNDQVVRAHRIETVPGYGSNPHKVSGGLVFDWIGTVFIPGTNLEQTLRMLQDYDHRAQYFSETIASSKLLCRRGDGQFRYTMRLKEPAVMDVESAVLWERLDPHRLRCASYSSEVRPVGKDKGYLRMLNSYWRFAENSNGVYVEGETVTLSDPFSSLMRGLGSLMGINPEKSLRHSLESMRETLGKSGMQFPGPATGAAECGEPYRPGRPAGCAETAR